MFLSEICNIIKTISIINLNKNREFSSITDSSQKANYKSILLINSIKFKNKYIIESDQKNIPAIITNKHIKQFRNTQFIVNNVDKEAQKILNKLLPYKPFSSIAITGTNGKTSVAWYLSQIFKHSN